MNEKRQIYSMIKVHENQRGAKSVGAQKLEGQKLKVRNLKEVSILMGIR